MIHCVSTLCLKLREGTVPRSNKFKAAAAFGEDRSPGCLEWPFCWGRGHAQASRVGDIAMHRCQIAKALKCCEEERAVGAHRILLGKILSSPVLLFFWHVFAEGLSGFCAALLDGPRLDPRFVRHGQRSAGRKCCAAAEASW